MPSSSVAGTRAVTGSPRRGRPYRSLTGRAAFDRVYRDGERRRRGGVLVLIAPGEIERPQVAVVAGRRVGGAVDRNRAKRRLRSAMERVPLRARTAYVVIAGREVVDVDFDRLVGWLSGAVEDRPEANKEDA